jgi:hypothetical protein
VTEAQRALARERQARKRERDRRFIEDLRAVLYFLAVRHPVDLEAAVQQLADETDRDPNTVFPMKRDSRPRKGRGIKQGEPK